MSTSVPFLGLTRFAFRNPASLTAARSVDRISSYSASPVPSGEYRLTEKLKPSSNPPRKSSSSSMSSSLARGFGVIATATLWTPARFS